MREMKDSGVAWIGEIPADWQIVKFSRIASVKCNLVAPDDYLELPQISPENIEKGSGKLLSYKTVEESGIISGNHLFHKGQLLYSKIRPKLNKVCIAPFPGLCSADMYPIESKQNIRFLMYCMLSDAFVGQVSMITEDRVKMPKINQDELSSLLLAFPPTRPEQQAIANFLDSKCTEIDAVLEKTRTSIEEYKKLKQAIITQAVTKGVRGDRPMKESGIEWVGRIPADWDVRRIKTLFSLRDERNTLPLAEVNLISLYTDQGVVQHADLEKTTGNKASNADGYKKVYQNDIIVNIILCWMGAIGRSDFDGVTSPAYDVYIPTDEIESRFYHYYFRTIGFSGDCYKRGRGIMAMRWRTYSDQFRDIPVVFPPIGEQQAVVKYLDKMCSQIDALIAKKEEVVSELESYKKSLIYEYVTGKKEVDQYD